MIQPNKHSHCAVPPVKLPDDNICPLCQYIAGEITFEQLKELNTKEKI